MLPSARFSRLSSRGCMAGLARHFKVASFFAERRALAWTPAARFVSRRFMSCSRREAPYSACACDTSMQGTVRKRANGKRDGLFSVALWLKAAGREIELAKRVQPVRCAVAHIKGREEGHRWHKKEGAILRSSKRGLASIQERRVISSSHSHSEIYEGKDDEGENRNSQHGIRRTDH